MLELWESCSSPGSLQSPVAATVQVEAGEYLWGILQCGDTQAEIPWAGQLQTLLLCVGRGMGHTLHVKPGAVGTLSVGVQPSLKALD